MPSRHLGFTALLSPLPCLLPQPHNLTNFLHFLQDANEYAKVLDIAKEKWTIWTGGFRPPGGSAPWAWQWTDGSAFTYSNWGEEGPSGVSPNGHEELYIEISPSKEAMNDRKDNATPFVCKCLL